MQILVKIFIFIITSIFILHVVLSIYESQNIKPPGKITSVGFYGQPVHMYCTSPPNPKSTVVLFLSGMGLDGLDWIITQQSLEKQNILSCAYDRPGLGFSALPIADAHMNRSLEIFSKELEDVLKQNFPKDQKYILVGHSLGGLFAQYFNNRNPNMVKGLVLLDSSSRYQGDDEDFLKGLAIMKKSLHVFQLLGKIGILRILNYFELIPMTIGKWKYLPETFAKLAFTIRSWGSYYDGFISEVHDGYFHEAKMQESKFGIHQVPVVFLEADSDFLLGKGSVEFMKKIHDKDVKLYKNVKRQVVKDSSHDTINLRADEIINAINWVLQF